MTVTRGEWRNRRSAPWLALCLAVWGCSEPFPALPRGESQTQDDGRPPADGGGDARRPDAARPAADAALNDAAADAALADAARPDAALNDAALNDAAPSDAALADAAPRDAAPADAGPDLDAAPADMAGPPPCPVFEGPWRVGSIGAAALNEASGLAASHRNPGVFWSHNDSDGGTRVFALSAMGEALGTYELDGPGQVDWEDVAVGPGPDPALSYVYVGDVGDNNSNRASIGLRRFPEPAVPDGGPPPTVRLAGVETFTLVYPDGAHNAGTLLVDPRTGDVFVVVAAANGESPVYRAAAPLVAGADNQLERVASLTFGVDPLPGERATTGGDISVAGDAIALRTTTSAFWWWRGRGMTVAEALAGEPCALPLAQEAQGEAFAFALDGQGYFTTSEGARAPLFFFGPAPDVEAADAAPPVVDAAPPVVDAAVEPVDAAVEPVDAAVEPVDAAVEPMDAAVEPVDAAAERPALPECPRFADPTPTGNLGHPEVIEASGVTESHRNPGVLWVHNDAGGTGRVYALSTTGAPLATFEVDGPRPRDWEDLAVGPGPEPGVSYVYVGDVGDNAIARQNVHLRRFPEPLVPREAEPPTVPLAGVEDFTLVYPDGPHNCETIMVDPLSGDVYLVTKSADGVSPIFRAAAPLPAGGEVRLERVASLTFGRAPLGGNASTTGGDIARDGSAIVVRTYSAAFLWRRAPGATIAEAFETEPCPLPRPRDNQGEAIGFARDGRGLFTVSEGPNTPVYFWERR